MVWATEMPSDWDMQTQGPWMSAPVPPRAADNKCAGYNYGGSIGNIACPSPSHLIGHFAGFNLPGDIHLGGRSDLNNHRHFTGRMGAFLPRSLPPSRLTSPIDLHKIIYDLYLLSMAYTDLSALMSTLLLLAWCSWCDYCG
jgi:hypothetical protein